MAANEYLATSYRPDREYVDGAVVERNLGEHDHSRLQEVKDGALRTADPEMAVPLAELFD